MPTTSYDELLNVIFLTACLSILCTVLQERMLLLFPNGNLSEKMKTMEETVSKNMRLLDDDTLAWYAMRDLKRSNAIDPAYKMLKRKGFEVFTPMRPKIVQRKNTKRVEEVPVMQDLLFVHTTRKLLDPVEAVTPTLRYRFVKGGTYKEATIVRDEDMNRFITVVQSMPLLRYYALDEVTPDMIGCKVRIYGGPLDGLEVPLRKMRGSKKKHIFVEIPNCIAAVVELKEFDFLQIV